MSERAFGVGVVLLAIGSAFIFYRITFAADARATAEAAPPPPVCSCYCPAPMPAECPHVP